MKLRIVIITFCLVYLTQQTHAQFETETVYNPRTGNSEQQYNPWNSSQQVYDRQQEANRRNSDANIRAIDAIDNAWQKSKQARQDLSNRMASMRMELQSRLNYGYAVIRAGKATTTYTPTPTDDCQMTANGIVEVQ